jgi:tRNA-dihydrouridine synthase 2
LADYYRQVNEARFERAVKLSPGPTTDLVWSVTEPCRKRLKLDSEEATRNGESRLYDGDVVEMSLCFVRRHYADEDLPRTVLFSHARKEKKVPPKFVTWQMERLFKSVVTFDGQKYTSHPG